MLDRQTVSVTKTLASVPCSDHRAVQRGVFLLPRKPSSADLVTDRRPMTPQRNIDSGERQVSEAQR